MAVLTQQSTRDDVQAPRLSTIRREDIEDLVQLPGRPRVSIYMPTFRAGVETQQNPIRLKNLLRAVQQKLEESGMESTDAAELMTPVRELVDDQAFWQTQSDGLAIFFSPEVFRTYRLPAPLDEFVLVNERFHLKPLFTLLAEEQPFYVLAISLKNIRLIEATQHHAQELEIPGVPQSLPEALGDLTRQYSQFQPGTSAKTVARSPIFHGHGTGEDNLKAEIVQFFNLADKALMKHMDRDVPVVLAGVEYLLPRYKETTEHPHVLDEGLTGNAEGLSPDELRDKAWEIVEPVLTADRRKAAERYGDLLGTGRASSRYEEILPAAHDGRIDTLFVARGVRLWGSYDEKKREVRLQEDQDVARPGGEDLLDLAAVRTFLNGGKVYAVPQQEVPDGQAMAAVFRY
jgi:Bacterial archaeo-eukaryotic release factor family 3